MTEISIGLIIECDKPRHKRKLGRIPTLSKEKCDAIIRMAEAQR